MMLPTEKLDGVKADAEFKRKHAMRAEALRLAEDQVCSSKPPERGSRARMGLVAKLGMGLKCKSSQNTSPPRGSERSSTQSDGTACDNGCWTSAGGAESSGMGNRGLLFRSLSRKQSRSASLSAFSA